MPHTLDITKQYDRVLNDKFLKEIKECKEYKKIVGYIDNLQTYYKEKESKVLDDAKELVTKDEWINNKLKELRDIFKGSSEEYIHDRLYYAKSAEKYSAIEKIKDSTIEEACRLYNEYLKSCMITIVESFFLLPRDSFDILSLFVVQLSAKFADNELNVIRDEIIEERQRRTLSYTYEVPLIANPSLFNAASILIDFSHSVLKRRRGYIIDPIYVYAYESLCIYMCDSKGNITEEKFSNKNEEYTKNSINIAYAVRNYYTKNYIIYNKFGLEIALDEFITPVERFFLFSRAQSFSFLRRKIELNPSKEQKDEFLIDSPEDINYRYAVNIATNFILSVDFYEYYYQFLSDVDKKNIYASLIEATMYEPDAEAARNILHRANEKTSAEDLYVRITKEIDEKLKKSSLSKDDYKAAVEVYKGRMYSYRDIKHGERYFVNLIIQAFQYGSLSFISKKLYNDIDRYMKIYLSNVYSSILPSLSYIEDKLEKDILSGNRLAKEFKEFFTDNHFLVKKGWAGSATYIVTEHTAAYLYIDELGARYLYRTLSEHAPRLKSIFQNVYSWTAEEDKRIENNKIKIKKKVKFVDMIKKIIDDDLNTYVKPVKLYNI